MGIDFCNATERENLYMHFSSIRDMDIKPLYTYLCPVIIFICFFSIIFNAILIGISRQSKVVNKSPILLLSLNLAATDLIASLLNGLGVLLNSYLPEVYDIRISQCLMLMFEVIRYAALVASALHLLALAFVHYRGIVNPLHYRSTIFFSQHLSRTINIISIVCWIIPLTIMVAWFSSSPCQGFQSANCDYLFLMAFSFRYMVVSIFAFPLILMSVIYVRIFIIINRHQKGRRLNHERSALTRGVISAAGPMGTAAAVNLPELIAKTDLTRCTGCATRTFKTEAPKEEETLIEDSKTLAGKTSNSSSLNDQMPKSTKKSQLRAQFSLKAANDPPKDVHMLKLDTGSQLDAPLGQRQHSLIGQQTSFDQHTRQRDHDSVASTEGSPNCECTCDTTTATESKIRQFNSSKLARANTIANDTQRALNKTMVTMSTSQRSSVSSVFVPTNLKSRLRRTRTTIGATSGAGGLTKNKASPQADHRSSGTSKYSYITINNPTSASPSYEPQRRHLHASAVPQTSTKALVTTLLILGTYFISYIPAIIFQALTCVDSCPYPLYDISYSRRVLLGAMTNLLLIAKSIIDPFIYSYRMSEIQVAIVRYFSKRRPMSSLQRGFLSTSQMRQTTNNNNNNNNQTASNATQPNSSFLILNVNNKIALRTASGSRINHHNRQTQSSRRSNYSRNDINFAKQPKDPDGSLLATEQDGNRPRLIDNKQASRILSIQAPEELAKRSSLDFNKCKSTKIDKASLPAESDQINLQLVRPTNIIC